MKQKLLQIAALSICLLTSCQRAPRAPDPISTLLETPFDADGKIHVLRATGKFVIRPNTSFCTYVPGINIDDLRAALKEMGQSDYVGGAIRTNGQLGERTSSECRRPKDDVVFIRGDWNFKRNGPRYKLMLAVWQGDPAKNGAIWIGGVERLSGHRPDANLDRLPIGDDMSIFRPSKEDRLQRAYMESSIHLDWSDLSRAFYKTRGWLPSPLPTSKHKGIGGPFPDLTIPQRYASSPAAVQRYD